MGLTIFQYSQFSRLQDFLPSGSTIAGVGVGGLNQQQAINQLMQAYQIPIEMHYGDAVIQAKPEQLGFELNLTDMLTEAEVQRLGQLGGTFWDYLWDRKQGRIEVELQAKVDEARVISFLKNEVAPRYDQLATDAMPVPGTTYYRVGQPGTTLEVQKAVPLITAALRSLSARTVELTASKTPAFRPSPQHLQVQLQQVLDLSGFDGISEIYLKDLHRGEEVHFAYQKGKILPPDIGFTAASTIKIPIMLSIFRHLADPAPQDVLDNMAKMVEVSSNEQSDWLMQHVLDKTTGPLEVTKDMQALGMRNTFLAGYFYPGAPLLKRFQTPANLRRDYFTDPDPYNQTTPAEMGQLLEDIYQCSENGGGTFAAVFPGQLTQSECNQMIQYMILNKLPVLITAGLPEGTKIGHKHGWIEELDGVVHTYCDVAIVYTPGGDYVLTVYLWKKDQLLFDDANMITAQISQAIYNYFNVIQP
jgi:beta-lactamase class A